MAKYHQPTRIMYDLQVNTNKNLSQCDPKDVISFIPDEPEQIQSTFDDIRQETIQSNKEQN